MSEAQNIHVDILIIGAGPAGLICAIRLMQEAKRQNKELQVMVLEKGGESGDHIVSGAILDPVVLNEVLPSWREGLGEFVTDVSKDKFYWLTANHAMRLPVVPDLNNAGNVITSLSKVCRWLGQQAEELGVMLLSGFPAAELIYDEGQVVGVMTAPSGLDKNGDKKPGFQEGTAVYAPVTVLAEGCRGHLTQEIISKFDLEYQPQNYGMGLKEVWRGRPECHEQGLVIHATGWPLDSKTYGGSFCYHWGKDLVSIGLIIGLDYENPFLNPYQELQKIKTSPLFAKMLDGGQPLAYGARALNEGGYQAIPKLSFPGGMIIGCAAGFLHITQLKGIHHAMRSAVIAADHILQDQLGAYDQAVRESDLGRELYRVRNIRPSFYKGRWFGVVFSGLSAYLLRGKEPWTWPLREDHLQLKPAKQCTRIEYNKPDQKLTFPLLTMLAKTGTNHEENQPCHLLLRDDAKPVALNLPVYDFPEGRYCPANVYEMVEKNGAMQLQINATNCIHCKTCDIKDPSGNIKWVPPQGGEGPAYQIT